MPFLCNKKMKTIYNELLFHFPTPYLLIKTKKALLLILNHDFMLTFAPIKHRNHL